MPSIKLNAFTQPMIRMNPIAQINKEKLEKPNSYKSKATLKVCIEILNLFESVMQSSKKLMIEIRHKPMTNGLKPPSVNKAHNTIEIVKIIPPPLMVTIE